MKRSYLNSGAPILISVLLATCVANPLFSQTEAGSRAGYGKVYEATGKSAAARNVQANMNLTLQRAVARNKKKAPAESTARSRGVTQVRSQPAPSRSSTAAANRSTYFKPDPNVDTASLLADSLGTTADEKAILRQLFAATKTAFESEVTSKGRQNNLAAAFTFFIATTATVYHDDPEPSDKAIDDLWDALNATLEETPDVAKLSDREKQELYDMVISFSGLLLAGYLEGKNNNDQETLRSSKTLAGALIQLVLKTDPGKLRFNKDGLMLG